MSKFKKADQSELKITEDLLVQVHQPGAEEAAEDLLAQIDRKQAERADKLRKLFATDDLIFAEGRRWDLEKASYSHGKFSEGTLRSLESIVAGVKPRDEIEAMVATQMAAIHNAIIDQSFKLGLSPDDNDTSEIRKLACTFPKQMEALDRHRAKGKQQGVQNVMVAAIVGEVHQQPLEATRASAPPPALTHSKELPMQPLAEVPDDVVVVEPSRRK
jgi:hypothetical protein